MNKSHNQIEQEVSKIKNKIIKVLPNVNDVAIHIDKNEDGQYESLIKVKVPKKKELFASKQAPTISKCLEKSHHAISRQIQKIKTKRHRNRINFSDIDMYA